VIKVDFTKIAKGFVTASLGIALASNGLAETKTEAEEVKEDGSIQESKIAAKSVATNTRLQSVVVTAQRREENIQEIPVSVTALDKKLLADDETIKTANDITQYIPNAQAPATDGRTRPRWFLRGIGTNETAPTTVSPIGVYQDEVYLNNVYIQGFPLFDSERVEVLRGPQGTLWGKNTTGGAVNFISKKPTFDTQGYFKAGTASFNERSWQGAITGSVIEDVLAVRVSTYNEERDGWVTNVTDGKKVGDVGDRALRLQVLWKPTEDFEALIALKRRSLVADKSPSFYALDAGPIANPLLEGPLDGRNSVAESGRSEDELDTEGVSAHLNWDFNGYTLTSITGYDEGYRTLWGGSPYTTQINRTRDNTAVHQTTQEIRFASPSDGRFNWIVGAFYFDESVDVHEASRRDAVPGLGTIPTSPSRFGFELTDTYQDTLNYSVFSTANYSINDSWSITSGLRYSYEEKDYTTNYLSAPNSAQYNHNSDRWWTAEFVTQLNPAVGARDKDDWNEVTYDISPQWHITKDVNAFVKYSKGFRAGGFVANVGEITKLDQEEIDAYEVGLKTQWLDNRLTVNTALFNYDYDNIIVGVLLPVPDRPGETRQVQENAASGYSRGLELELSWSPDSQLRVGGSLGYLDTEYENYFSEASGQSINANGNRFTRSPEFSLGFFGEYAIPLESGAEIGFATDWSWRSKQYYNAVNQTNPKLSQDAYALGNARLFWQSASGHVEATLYVRNITDKVYSVLATGPAQGRTRQVYGLPRSVGASVTWNIF
jgi:iron complex outermembrane receptor protein